MDGAEMSEEWLEEFRLISGTLDGQALGAERQIRAQLESLRIVSKK